MANPGPRSTDLELWKTTLAWGLLAQRGRTAGLTSGLDDLARGLEARLSIRGSAGPDNTSPHARRSQPPATERATAEHLVRDPQPRRSHRRH